MTRSQHRLKYLETLGRPLTGAEQDELYRCLHADYMLKWRAHRAEREATAHARKQHEQETAVLLKKVEVEARPKLPPVPFDEQLRRVRDGTATIYAMPAKVRNDPEFTLGGVSSGWAA